MDRRRAAVTALVALGGALPSLLGALDRPFPVQDDWSASATARLFGWAGFGWERHSRPVQGTLHFLAFEVLGTHPVAHLLLLAVLNAVAAVLVVRVARRWLPVRLAVLVATCWVTLPNRASGQLWASTAPNLVALVLVLLAAGLVVSPETPRRLAVVVAAGLVAAAALTYEGSLGIGAFVVVAGLARSAPTVRAGVARAGAGLAGLGALALSIRAVSAKTGPSHPGGFGRLVPIHFGVGVLPDPLLLLGLAVLVAALAGAVRVVLPGFRRGTGVEERLVLVGLAGLLLGAAPFLASGFPSATDGIFDRGNLFADLGTALVWAGVLGLLWRLRRPVLATVAATLVVAVVAAGFATDLRDYRRAGDDGRAVLAGIDGLPPSMRDHGPLAVAPLPNRGGVATFVADYDLSAALALRYRTGRTLPDARVLSTEEQAAAWPGAVFRLHGARLIWTSRAS